MTLETQQQFDAMAKIGAIVANCLALMKSKAVPGMTTAELDAIGQSYLQRHGARSAPQLAYNFPGATCISVEADCAHGIPSDRVLRDQDLVNIDVSAELDGFFADNGESFVVGAGTGVKAELCAVVRKALNAAIKQAVAGRRLNALGKEVERIAGRAGFKTIHNLGGHGVGSSLHEAPEFIPGYFDASDRRLLQMNAVIAYEPFISSGGSQVRERQDGWTLFVDGGFAVQKEHTILVRKGAPHIFTRQTETFAS